MGYFIEQVTDIIISKNVQMNLYANFPEGFYKGRTIGTSLLTG